MTSFWRTCFLVSFVLLLISGLFNWFQYDSNTSKDSTYKADKEASETRHARMKQENDSLTALVLTERVGRAKSDSVHQAKQSLAISEIKSLKRRERFQRPDSGRSQTLTDTIYQRYDSVLLAEELQRKADSVSFQKEIATLQVKALNLETFADQSHQENLKLYDDLSSKEKLIGKLRGWLVGLGISTTALTVITVLLIAL